MPTLINIPLSVLLFAFLLICSPSLQAAQPVRTGFTTNGGNLGHIDDSPSKQVPFGFTINMFGTNYSNCYVNNNGNITFDAALPSFSPSNIATLGVKIIAPYWSDVDTRPAASGVVSYGQGTVNGRAAWAATWDHVGYYSQGTDKLNTYQVVIINRSDLAVGAFDIEFNYDSIQYDYASAADAYARAGYTNGSNVSYEVPGSGIPGAFLNSNPNGLIHQDVPYLYHSANGVVTAVPGVTTLAATNVLASGSATLNGQVNPGGLATTVVFEYGTAANLTGATTTVVQNLPAGSVPVNVSQALTGLTPGMDYYFRVSATNPMGNSLGNILSFPINLNPTITRDQATVAVNEGTVATNSGAFVGHNGHVLTVTASTGTITQPGTATPGTWSWSANATDGPASSTVTVTVRDSTTTATGTATFSYTINNVVPLIALTGATSTNSGVSYTLNLGAITDPGTDTVTAYSINWGDGVTENFSGSPANTARTHVYASNQSGSKVITVFLTDEDGLHTGGTLGLTVGSAKPINTVLGDVVTNGGAAAANGTDRVGDYDGLRRGGFMGENGDIVFPSFLKVGSSSPAVTAANSSGTWKVVGGTTSLIARTGMTVPDLPGAQFATLPEVPGIAESGEVSVLASLVVGSGGVTTANDTGAWSEVGGGGLRLLMREDDNIPSVPGAKVAAFASGIYATAKTGASSGEAVFSVTMKGASTKTVLLRASVNGATTTVSTVAEEGQTAPGTAALYANVAGGFSDPGRMDAQGNFVYAALTTTGSKEGIWYQPVTGGTPSKVVFAGDTASGTGGATFLRIQRPVMGSNGFISFRASLNKDGDNAPNLKNDGIWNGFANNPASLICVLRRGDGQSKVSNLPVGSLVGNPWQGWLTNTNLGAWRAWLDMDGDGISSTADGDVNAIFANLSGAMQLAVKVGDAAPGTTGATFSGFDLPMVGGNNQYAILGNLTGGDTVVANNQGLWRSALNGGALALVLRKGDSVVTTAGSKVVTKIDVPGSNQTDRRWEQQLMDSTGRMIVIATFTDGSTSQVIIP
ncbi:MAG: nidogen-like domain-containing protein [Verrucomicrobiota bacterium]